MRLGPIVLFYLLGGLTAQAQAWPEQFSNWTFNTDLQTTQDETARLSAWPENAELSLHDSAALGLRRPVGGHTGVLALPPAPAGHGLRLEHGAAPNGVFAEQDRLSNYALVFDLLWPGGKGQRLPLLQSDRGNNDPAELLLRVQQGQLQLGVDKRYFGAMQPNRWYRIAINVQAASGRGGVGQIHTFVNGLWLASHMTPGEGSDNRWALHDNVLLFTDEAGRDLPVYLANLAFYPRLLPHQRIETLGGVHARGADQPGRRHPQTRRASRRVGVVAHRGNSCCAPENTLAAIQQALDLGVEGIEIDIRLSADGHAVLMHDADLSRTTNGRGKLSQRTLAQLQRLDAGSWFDPRYAAETVPSLSDVLRLCGERSLLYLDIKDNRLAPAIARALKETGHSGRNLRIWEVDSVDDLRRFRAHLPGIPFHWGSVPAAADPHVFPQLKALGVVGFEVPVWEISNGFLQRARAHGLPVTAYTLYDPDSMLALIERGIDLIETDFPRQLLKLLPPPASTGAGAGTNATAAGTPFTTTRQGAQD